METAERVFGPGDTLVADLMLMLGEVYRQRGELDKAEPLWVRALAIRIPNYGEEHSWTQSLRRNLASLYSTRAEANLQAGQQEEALADFSKAVAHDAHSIFPIYERLRKRWSADRYQEEDKNAVLLEKLLRQAIAAFEKLTQASPAEPGHVKACASAQNLLGDLLCVSHRDAAERAHRQAIANYERLTLGFPPNAEYHENLGHAYRCLAYCLDQAASGEERARLMGLAVAQLKEATELEPTGSRPPWRRLWLADMHRSHADELLSLNRAVEAEQQYRKSIEVASALTAESIPESPPAAQTRHHLHLCFAHFIQFLTANGRTQEAEQIHLKAIDLYQRFVAERPDEPYFAEALKKEQEALAKLKEM
jgi:tetratricopeptide (TPR) repeat protein